MLRRLIPILDTLIVVTGIITVISLIWNWIPLITRSLLPILGFILIGIALYMGRNSTFRKWAIRQYPTPYDVINKRIGNSNNTDKVNDKFYDLFISYKTDDVMKIRPLVEQMLASGVNVWFAEYTINLEEQKGFKQAIDKGIAHSKYGLCFTNNQYIASEYCRDELEQLLLAAENCEPKKLIEIGFPPEPLSHQRYPQLEAVNSICYDGNINRLIGQINKISNLSIQSALPTQMEPPAYLTFGYTNKQYQLDFAGWEITNEGSTADTDGEATGPRYERMCGEYQIRGYLHIGTSIAFPRAQHQTDDRKNYEYGIEFAKAHYAQIPAQCIGVHLFFSHGLSHIALTARGAFGWCRTYSVIIPISGTKQQVEFLFDFYIQSPFGDFCRCTHHMDRVVQSLAWL